MVVLQKHFDQALALDFEFHAPPGGRPQPLCMVAREIFSDVTYRLWFDENVGHHRIPFTMDDKTLVIAYFASAEIGCFLALGWPLPVNLLDLYVEFRNQTNGSKTTANNSLIGALRYHDIPAIDTVVKDAMRDIAIRGGPFSQDEIRQLIDYCESDVSATCDLLEAMIPKIDMPRALLRGRYMKAVAKMEWNGTPMDRTTLKRLCLRWEEVQAELINKVDVDYGVYDGTTFKQNRFSELLVHQGISWPRLPSGRLALDDDTFKQMAKTYPSLAPLREVRKTLSKLRLTKLVVGSDDRNRCMLSPFSSKTSRNQPSNSKFIFGAPAWFRGLIKPPKGRAVAYIDYSQQELGIAAALSRDEAMMQAYNSSDPYIKFAIQAGAAPESATKESHPQQRELFKTCALGVQYGMQAKSLALAIGRSEIEARSLLKLHEKTYPTYWKWSQAAVDHAMLFGWLQTVFGWRIHVGVNPNPRGLANFPMQSNGAEILRLACCLCTEQGITVCAPVHDALLIEADMDSIDEVVAATQENMSEAGRIVLDGFELRTDAEIVRWPDRYMDKRGEKMWTMVMSILEQLPFEPTR